MLKSLIENLETVKCMKLKNGCFLKQNSLLQENYIGLQKTINILNSLVNKIMQDKNYDDDIASCHSGSFNIKDEPFPNYDGTEEFFNKVKNIHIENNDLQTYFIQFLDLLSDLVFSICEVNNVDAKLASGITVKDLGTVKNLYLALWEMLTLHCHTQNTLNNSKQREEGSPETYSVSDVVNAVESCLKVMSRVKLDIEHYIKSNLIELQFKKQEDGTELENVTERDELVKHDKPEGTNEQGSKGYPQEFIKLGKKQKSTVYNVPDIFSEHQEHDLSSCLYHQNRDEWDDCYDYSFAQEPHVNVFNTPIIYSPDFLIFEPRTVVLKSQLEPKITHSLPKIYSVDSVNENAANENDGNNYCFGDKERTEPTLPEKLNSKKENNPVKQEFENSNEDLFNENSESKMRQDEYIQLKENISTLLTMLKTDKTNYSDDIFRLEPVKIEDTNLPNYHKQNEELKQTKTKKNKVVIGNKLCKSITRKLKSENEKRQDITNKKVFGQNKPKKEQLNKLSKQCGIQLQNPMKVWAADENEVIYDKHSVIELFKPSTKGDESFESQKNNFGLWPVVAEYIYVSKGDGSEKCHSVSSCTTLLNKNFEKSFYSLHMNKKYEQKRIYDGDIIVLDQTKKLQKERISTDSFCLPLSTTCKAQTVAENNLNLFYSDNSADMNDSRNRKISINNLLVPTDCKGIRAQQQTYAVHYADCADSFVVTRNYKKEKINFFDVNGNNSSQNWNSFLSIITKFGTNTHFNEGKMFRKIVKNLGAESLHVHNLFGNVQTLTSSRGPFRLFDINGYPLTDSEGNVLRDPYGKSVVQLDSTGLPKDDTKVFDAAGFSPKDIKFDPTQKPHTNCIIIKLTDSFKRPLHLFDKYGRPLTDYSGKLLVNIHGRPLLRFDNFGRPITDYRGGLLYTDNGFRWSFQEQQGNDITLNSHKVDLQNETISNTAADDSHCANEEKNCCSINYSSDCIKQNTFAPIASRNSDVWLQVENVLQKYSTRNKLKVVGEPSEIELLANDVTVKPDPGDGDYLSPIIYHNDGANRCAYYNVTDNRCANGFKILQVDDMVTNSKRNWENHYLLKSKLNYDVNKICSTGDVSPPVLNNIKLQSNATKCLNKHIFPQELNYLRSNFIMEKNDCKDQQILPHENNLRKKHIMGESLCRLTNNNNTVPNFNFTKNDYINNLCNGILKSQMESKIVLNDTSSKIPLVSTGHNGKKDNLTDITLSSFTSSFVSKYTNKIPLYSESPTASVEYQDKDSQRLPKINNSKYEKHEGMKNVPSRSHDVRNRSGVKVKMERKDELMLCQVNKNKDQRYKAYPKKDVQASRTSTKTNTSIDVINKSSNQYQINVRERMRTGYQPREDNKYTLTANSCATEEKYFLEKENCFIKNKINVSEKDQIAQPMKPPNGVHHGEYCRHFKKEKDCTQNVDSPFRFPSEEKIEMDMAINNSLEFVDDQNWLEQEHNLKFERGYLKQAAFNPKTLYPKRLTKPQRNNRDCNLVSFLGTPVKYVLNKLDTKLSSRQEKKHKYLNTIHPPKKEYNKNGKYIKTLFYSSKDQNKFSTSTETYESKGKQYRRKGEQIIPFKSKSYSEIHECKVGNMSYSGSQETSNKCLPESKSNKCSSDTVVSTSLKRSCHQRKHRKYGVVKPQSEKYSFETHYVHTSNTTNPQLRRRNEKSPKGFNKHKSKSPKVKPVRLFKQSGHSGDKTRAWLL